MNPDTGAVYRTPEEIKEALARGERLVPVSDLAHAHHTSHTRYVGGGNWKPSNREDIRMEKLATKRLKHLQRVKERASTQIQRKDVAA